MIHLLTKQGQFFDWGERRLDPLPPDLVFLDLFEPTRAEEIKAELWLDTPIPVREEMEEIEESSRLYQEGDSLYMTVPVPVGLDTPEPSGSAITFILSPQTLTTVRYAAPSSWRVLPDHVRRQCGSQITGDAVFFVLVDLIVSRIADKLETVEADLANVARDIFRASPHAPGESAPVDLEKIIHVLGRRNALVTDLRECLIGLARMLAYCLNRSSSWMRGDMAAQLRSVARDVKSLDDHTNQQTHEMAFLLQSTLGLINTSQNQIIKIFTVAGVIFMPPTLVASIWGMNLGLPVAQESWAFLLLVILIIVSAVLPIWYFKRKRLL